MYTFSLLFDLLGCFSYVFVFLEVQTQLKFTFLHIFIVCTCQCATKFSLLHDFSNAPRLPAAEFVSCHSLDISLLPFQPIYYYFIPIYIFIHYEYIRFLLILHVNCINRFISLLCLHYIYR